MTLQSLHPVLQILLDIHRQEAHADQNNKDSLVVRERNPVTTSSVANSASPLRIFLRTVRASAVWMWCSEEGIVCVVVLCEEVFLVV